MDLRKFGDSELMLSKMGLGLAALGRPGYINLGHKEDLEADYDERKMELHTHQMLSEARQLGINYFDAAQSYGKAELFLQSWLNEHPDEDVVAGSKWGYYYTAGWSVNAEKHEIKEHTIGRLNQQWPESKQRLAPRLKLYQIHSATFESGVLENRPVLEKLDEIRSDGYLIGLSLSGPQQSDVLQKALTIQVSGKPLFGCVQATYNFLEQSAGEALRKAHDHGLGVIIKEGLANGRLTDRNNEASFMPRVQQIASSYDVGVDAVALAFILSQPFVHVVLSGAATREHLQANAAAVHLELSAEDKSALDKLNMPAGAYWQERSRLSWN